MRLFIEVGPIIGERSGIGQYTKRLVEAYHKYYPKTEIYLFGFKFITQNLVLPIKKDMALNYKIIRWFPRAVYSRLFKKGINIPIDLLMGIKKNDLVLYTNFIKWPHAFNKKSIAVLHDVSFITHGEYTSPANKKYMLENVPKTIKKVSRVITISENSKKDLVKYYGLKPEKINIVYPFVDTEVINKSSAMDIKKIKSKYLITKKYFLFIGNIEPRKNLIGVLIAYSQLPEKIKQEYNLVIAGGKGWLNNEIHTKIEEINASNKYVLKTGYVPDEDIPHLISGASIFIFIPFYEGFGIPPLEAMACGVPVISSNNSSLPEAVGDAGYYVDANKPDQTTKAIKEILNNPKLRNKLIKNGYRQISKFTPEKSACQLHDALTNLDS